MSANLNSCCGRGVLALKTRKILLAVFTALIAFGLLGCLRIMADELYRLPRASEEYLKLQQQIYSILSDGAEFAPPHGGPNRQAVQFVDLDGDGENEVIAFFSVPHEGTLKIYIFRMVDGDYVVADVIEGVGTAIESIRYVDMDGDGVKELIVGWQMGAALKHMAIYSIRDFEHVLLASAEYTTITVYDMTGDGTEDVVVTRLPTPETGAVAELFILMADGEMVSREARLSNGIEAITGVLTGSLTDGAPAIFIESEGRFDYGAIVTDVCTFKDGSFENVSLRAPVNISLTTVRDRVDSADITRDGIISVPTLRRLQAQSETDYYVLDWYAFNSHGQTRLILTTYHNNFDGWYLILPFNWRGRVSVRREDAVPGERTVIFSHIAGEEGSFEDFLKVHRLTGNLGRQRAELPGRTVLTTDGDSIFAFEIIAEPNSLGLSFDEDLIKANFRLIRSDWLSE